MAVVESSSIEAVGYDSAARALYVRFVANHATYVYEDVDADVYRQLLEAESKGRYVNQVVKPRFNVRRL